MVPENKNIDAILCQRLIKKGVEPTVMRGFLLDLVSIFSLNPDIELRAATDKLKRLGWDDFELDDHTLQLSKACFENDRMRGCIHENS
jgi:hypothetical protein